MARFTTSGLAETNETSFIEEDLRSLLIRPRLRVTLDIRWQISLHDLLKTLETHRLIHYFRGTYGDRALDKCSSIVKGRVDDHGDVPSGTGLL